MIIKTSNIITFVEDTKMFRKVNNDGDKQHLQNDLNKLVKCLHTGHRNLDVNYNMKDTVLSTIIKERDLGVTTSADMKASEQCHIAASKGNQIIGLIRRNITYKEKS